MRILRVPVDLLSRQLQVRGIPGEFLAVTPSCMFVLTQGQLVIANVDSTAKLMAMFQFNMPALVDWFQTYTQNSLYATQLISTHFGNPPGSDEIKNQNNKGLRVQAAGQIDENGEIKKWHSLLLDVETPEDLRNPILAALRTELLQRPIK